MHRHLNPPVRALLAGIGAATVLTALLVATPAQADQPAPDPTTAVTFLVGLHHDRAGLDEAAVKASSPSSPGFRHYLSVPQAAARFGATAAVQRRLEDWARAAGMTALVDPSRLFARVTGTVATWERAVSSPMDYDPAAPGSAQWEDQPPFALYRFRESARPPSLAQVTTWWMPSYALYDPSLDIPGLPPAQPATRALVLPDVPDQNGPTNTGSPLGPTCLDSHRNQSAFTPFQVSTAYGMRGLQQRVDAGLEPIVTVLSLGGGVVQSDLDTAAACFGYSAPRIGVLTGLGLPQPIVSLSAESALDLQTVSWALHGARRIRFVQVINSDTAWLESFALALSGWATPPQAVSVSWGGCELLADPDAGPNLALESLFRMAAVVGVSLFAAAGDNGSSACQHAGTAQEATYAAPTVNYPASSPWMTAVGGTQLQLGERNARVVESVWNDLQYGLTGNAVGTGGPSALFSAPWYQRPRTWSDVRTVPDLAAQAGMHPSMTVFVDGKAANVAGTSQASPLVAAGFAMLSARRTAAGRPPLGFVNPWLYLIVRQHPEVVHDVTAGDNQYPVSYAPQSLNIPACCQATPGYDMASGLGSPAFDRIARVLD